MEEIFKIQLPIRTTEPVPKALIYNEDRSIEEIFPASSFKSLFENGEMKIFHYGELIDGTLNINHRAPNQEW